jgi:quinol monooxygenase YgiN
VAPENKVFDKTFAVKSFEDAEKAIGDRIKEFDKFISEADNEYTGCADYQNYRDRLSVAKRELTFAIEILRELEASVRERNLTDDEMGVLEYVLYNHPTSSTILSKLRELRRIFEGASK